MPPQNDTWNFKNDPPPNPDAGDHLNGLHIKKNPGGYEIKVPGANNPLASTNVTQPPFDFTVRYGNRTWNIHVETLPPGLDGAGKWHISSGSQPGGDPNDGDFKAQAGAGADDDEGEAKSSAYA